MLHAPPARPVRALLWIALAVWGWTYGLTGLMGADETRYVQVGKELLGRSNWVLLTLFGEPYDQKPPLPFWMFALALKAAGGEVTTWTVRMPSVLLGLAAVLAVFETGRRRWSPAAGWAAALILASAPLFLRQTPTARLDVLYTGWIALAMAAWLARPPDEPMTARRRLLFWGATAGAFFTKGPLAFLIVLGVPLAESAARRSLAPWRELGPLKGLGSVLALVALWFTGQGLSAGWPFVWRQIAGETVERVARGDHANPLWYYAYSLFTVSFMPWTLVAAVAVWTLARERRGGSEGARAWETARPVLLWIAVPLVVLHLSSGKRHQYLLPVLPALALAAGAWVERAAGGGPAPAWLRRAASGACALAAAAALGAAGVLAVHPGFLDKARFETPAWGAPLLAVMALAAAGLSRTVWRSSSGWVAFHAAAALLLMAGTGMLGVLEPGFNTKESGQAAARLLTVILEADETRVAALEDADDSLYYVYGDFEIRRFDDKARTFADPSLPPVVVASLEDLKKLRSAAEAAGYVVAGRINSGGDDIVVFRREGK